MLKNLETWEMKTWIQIEPLEIKITMSEIKNTLDGINCRLDITEEKKIVNFKT